MRWFYKVTESIPVIGHIPLGSIDGIKYRVRNVQAGINSASGIVYINYTYEPMWSPFFWDMHFHEFLHRLFWLMKWKKGHDIIDFINTVMHIHSIKKQIRKKPRR